MSKKFDLVASQKFTRRESANWLVKIALHSILADIGKKYLAAGHPQMAGRVFDHIGAHISLFGRYELDLLNLVFAWLEDAGLNLDKETAVDVGANIGNHSLYFAERFQNVVSVEPNPDLYPLLRINAALRNNILVHAVGCSGEPGTGWLAVQRANLGGGGLSSDAVDTSDYTVQVPLHRLDDLIGDQQVRLLKIDVEGHEIEVLRGGHKLLARNKPVVMYESKSSKREDRIEVHRLLQSFGYQNFLYPVATPRPSRTNGTLSQLLRGLSVLVSGRGISLRKTKNIELLGEGKFAIVVAVPPWMDTD